MYTLAEISSLYFTFFFHPYHYIQHPWSVQPHFVLYRLSLRLSIPPCCGTFLRLISLKFSSVFSFSCNFRYPTPGSSNRSDLIEVRGNFPWLGRKIMKLWKWERKNVFGSLWTHVCNDLFHKGFIVQRKLRWCWKKKRDQVLKSSFNF